MTPGPGNYGALEVTDGNIRAPVSKYYSASSTRFGKSERKGLNSSETLKMPPPGTCTISLTLDNVTKEKDDRTSKYYISRGVKWSVSQRKGLNDKKMDVPGPGA